MIAYPRPNLNEPFDEPFDGSPYFFTPEVELPEYVQKIVSQNPHLQPGFVSLKPVATRLIPPNRVLTSLILFSTSPRPLYALITLEPGSRELVTIKPILGNSSPTCHSILYSTLRGFFQLFAWYRKSMILTCIPELGGRPQASQDVP